MTVKPMLARKMEPTALQSASKFLITHKYDGFRALTTSAGPRSRSGRVFMNRELQAQLARLPIGLDGEILAGHSDKTPFNVTQSVVNSAESQRGELFTYIVYDYFYNGSVSPATDRLARLRDVFSAHTNGLHLEGLHVVLAPASYVPSIPAAYQKALEDGYEGICARHADSVYKFGRVGETELNLVAMKEFITFEAEILECEEKLTNENDQERDHHGYAKRSSAAIGKTPAGVLGAFNCRAINGEMIGAEFNVGSGFTAAQRRAFWDTRDEQIGRVIELKYQRVGSLMKPRAPIFIRRRDHNDGY